MLRIRFRVFRYKPKPNGKEGVSRFDVFDVPVGPQTTVLDALQYIRQHQAPDLVFRYSCYHASCGTCGLRINGQERLACQTRVQELGTSEVTLEPLAHLPLLADLAVDMGAFYYRYTPARLPLVRESESTPKEGVLQFTRFENCIECGLCLSACPVVGSDPAYIGPAGLAAAWRVLQEPRGIDIHPVLAWVDQEHGCWRCHAVLECSAVCPAAVFPGEAIMALRGWLLRSPAVPRRAADRHILPPRPARQIGWRAWLPRLGRRLSLWAFALNRLAALALVVYLFLHLWTLRLLLQGEAAWDAFIQKAKTPVFLGLDALLLLAVLFHGLNGVRLLLVESGMAARHHRRLLAVVVLATVLFWGLAMVVLVQVTR